MAETTDGPLRVRVRDGIALLALDLPPVNALGAALRGALAERIASFDADPTVRAIVLTAEGRYFSAGADIRELGQRPVAGIPDLGALHDRIEACGKPVVAALGTPALGGGAELAMAAHWRLAAAGAGIGLPEISLGLVPGAGGTQRLPRLVGAEAAMAMMLAGRPVGAETARRIGLVDGVHDGDAASAGFAFATDLLARGSGPRPTRARRERLLDGAAWMAAVAAQRRDLGPRPALAAARIVDCVEVVPILPFVAGLAFERAAFEDCLASAESQAMRHLFLAERRAPEALVTRVDGKRQLGPSGDAVARRLSDALGRAGEALVRLGRAEAAVDGAAVAAGFAAGPFGGTAPAADPQLWRRLVGAAAAAGARAIEAGEAASPGEVDAVAALGLGWPRASGGPMFAAERTGLPALRRDMTAWAAEDRVWAVPMLMTQGAKLAGGFAAALS